MNAAAENLAEHSEPRVLIADDQNLVRTGFWMILCEAGIPVVAEAADGGKAVAAAPRDRPPQQPRAVAQHSGDSRPLI